MPPDFTCDEQIQYLKCLGATERAINMFKELQQNPEQSKYEFSKFTIKRKELLSFKIQVIFFYRSITCVFNFLIVLLV